jgi:ppGpp synthetase/RelA/SpoT-type nucleotidyltranferase
MADSNVSVTDLDALRLRYQSERPRYQALADEVAAQLGRACRQKGLLCDIDARAKEVGSFLKKVLRKDYASPWEDIRDKAGVRVITVYESQVSQVEEIVHELFHVSHHEDKRTSLRPETLSYLGVHFEVSLLSSPSQEGSFDLSDLICEIQLHTRAQNLWATVSHELLYKPVHEAPPEVSRAIYRLMALIEFFDGEVERSRQTILSLPGYEEANLLELLERHFYMFASGPTDSGLSLRILTVLLPLLGATDIGAYETPFGEFIDANRPKLEEIFTDYRNDDRNPLLSQPECLLIFERLTSDRFQLTTTWGQHLPPNLLGSLSDIWGTPVDV